MILSPLRYPGGKTRAVKHILPLIPKGLDELCSPFFGGGSIEIAYAKENPDCKVQGYDVFEPIVWFWKALLENPERLAEKADKLRCWSETTLNNPETKAILEKLETLEKEEKENFIKEKEEYVDKLHANTHFVLKKRLVRGLPNKEDFKSFREELKEIMKITDSNQFSFENAAKVYAINRSSFSGATFSGGYSKRAAYARFTDSSIKRVRDFKVPNLSVKLGDYKNSIIRHPNAFLYCDPPYKLDKESNKLYGSNGDTHHKFDHEGLYELLKERKGWVLSYNKCEWVLERYKDYNILDAKWAYGMTNAQSERIAKMKNVLKECVELLEERMEEEKLPELEKSVLFLKNEIELLKKSQKESSEVIIIG
jgi:DNA adenine methylase